MKYWYCKNGEVIEISRSEYEYKKANGEHVTTDPFVAAQYLDDHNY